VELGIYDRVALYEIERNICEFICFEISTCVCGFSIVHCIAVPLS